MFDETERGETTRRLGVCTLIDTGRSTGDFDGTLADQIEGDTDFDNIRTDPRYADLLEKGTP